VLDIWGEEGATGKSLGTDLEKQKLTLPVIRLLSVADPASALRIRRLLSDPKPESRVRLRPYLDQTGALDYAWQLAKQHVRLALLDLDCLADSAATAALRTLAQYVIRRPA
jgi:octaprenyl-diphosphate synthase